MEFKGRIQKVLGKREGVSQRTGQPWCVQEFIFEYFEHDTDRYSDSVVLETMDTNVMEHLKEGAPVYIGFGHRVEEYNGRHYNRLRMYRCEFLDDSQPAPPQNAAPTAATATAAPTTKTSDDDDLPF